MDLVTKDRYGKNLFHKICQKGDLAKFNEVVGSVTDFTVRSDNGSSYLHFATQGGIPEICQYLIDRGLNGADNHTKDGRAPIHIAADCGFADILALFIRNKVNPDALTSGKETALMIACEGGHLDCVQVLIEKGANVNHALSNTTPLERACWSREIDIVKLLIEKDADVNAKIGESATPLVAWLKMNNASPRIITLLKAHGAKAK